MPDDKPTEQAGLPEDVFIARMFTLADHAEANNVTGKISMIGGGITNIWTTPIPGPLTQMYLAFRIRVPWQKATEPFTLTVRVLTADRQPVGNDPLLTRSVELGRPAGYRPGDELAINGSLGLAGLPIRAYGTIFFHLEVDGSTIAVHPLKIDPLSAVPRQLVP
jgi:hypothetical protein